MRAASPGLASVVAAALLLAGSGCPASTGARVTWASATTVDWTRPDPARLRVVSTMLGDERGWRLGVMDELRAAFARRIDLDALPWWTNVTVWLRGDVLVGAEIATSALTGASIFAVKVDVDGVVGWYDAAGRSLAGPFRARPLDFGRVTSRTGLRVHPVLGRWRYHHGTDYAAPRGTPVVSVGPGVVKRVGRDRIKGLHVVVAHAGGVETRYLHLSRVDKRVAKKRRVQAGQVIGRVGATGLATGPHLHFEVRKGRKALDAVGIEWPPGPALREDLLVAHRRHIAQLWAWKRAAIARIASSVGGSARPG